MKTEGILRCTSIDNPPERVAVITGRKFTTSDADKLRWLAEGVDMVVFERCEFEWDTELNVSQVLGVGNRLVRPVFSGCKMSWPTTALAVSENGVWEGNIRYCPPVTQPGEWRIMFPPPDLTKLRPSYLWVTNTEEKVDEPTAVIG